jgi:Tfp pilus assembly protein PilV
MASLIEMLVGFLFLFVAWLALIYGLRYVGSRYRKEARRVVERNTQ